MKTKRLSKHKTLGGVFVLSLMFILVCFANCSGSFIEEEQKVVTPPDASKTTEISTYFPDSGGIATKIILNGKNFGTDTSYIKVTVNGKSARVVGSDGDAIYAIVPARADTGFIKVLIGKEPNIKEFTYEGKFKYQFKRNVTTLFGKNGQAGTDDGAYTNVKLRRPWFVTTDNDGVLYFIDEGRGVNSDGALRKAYEGVVTTLLRNSGGPMQSPTALAFNPKQDTLYLVNSLWQANSMVTDAAIACLTRETGFIQIKPFVKATYTKCTAIAVHPKTGDIFYNSQNDGYIYKFNRGTKVQEQQFQLNGTDTELRMIFSLDGKTLYIMVKNKHCIYKADFDAATATVKNPKLWVGQWNSSGFENGIGNAAKFNTPGQGAVDEDGNLFVPDKENDCIRKITPDGFVSTYAGVPQGRGYKDGDPSVAQFNRPEAVSFGPDGGLYVMDRENHLMRKVMVE
ncbi:MAG: SMP-30/gluconolactonase/LRE family protein [Dysgonomonas sp.]